MSKTQDSTTSENDYWSKIYNKFGHTWGDTPSTTAQHLHNQLPRNSRIFEAGYGYGRDIVYLSQKGHCVHGIDISSVGYKQAIKTLNDNNIPQSGILTGDFAGANLRRREYDAVMYHRVVHLENKEDVHYFVEQSYKILKPNGLLCISARDSRDFNEETMIMRDNCIAEYKDRPGHIINFWDERRFKAAFNDKFFIEKIEKSTEIESKQNPVDTYITTMIARKMDI